jgi:alcohol dehydrogenase
MASMIAAGSVDLGLLESRPFGLDQLNEALDEIEANGNGFANFHIRVQ